jgi:hypothetical protein
MSIPLLNALTQYYDLVDEAAIDPSIVVPPELDFKPGPQDDLESMIWVLTYAIMVRYQQSLQPLARTNYKCKVVDQFYGSLSYSGLAMEREIMVYRGSNSCAYAPGNWIPDPTQRKWFRRAMTLVDGQIKPAPDGNNKIITFDAFDALCDEFIMDK